MKLIENNSYVSNEKFVKFLVKAKKATYASGAKPDTLSGGECGFYFQEEDLTYYDIYRDRRYRAGGELLSCDSGVFWILNYHGGIITLPDEFAITADQVFSFLRKALMNISEEIPFRGPTFFKEGLWRYTHWWMKNATGFNGYEAVWYGPNDLYKVKIYELHFHCGSLV